MRGTELLRKYVASDLTDAERFELEKLALDDDFLASAWEGLSSDEKEISKDALSRLEKRLSRVEGRDTKIIPIYRKMWPYAVAASLVLGFFYLRPMADGVLPMNQEVALTDVISESDQKTSIASMAEDEVTMPEDEEIKIEMAKSESEVKDQLAISLTTNENSNKEKEVDSPSKQPRRSPEIGNDPSEPKGAAPIVSSIRSQDQETIPNKILESDDDIPNDLTLEELAIMPEEEKPIPMPEAQDFKIDLKLSKLKTASESSPTIISGNSDVGFIAYRKANDTGISNTISIDFNGSPLEEEELAFSPNDLRLSAPEPVIGHKAYKEVLREKTTVTREDLFMRGIDANTLVQVRFTINEKGLPDQIKFENLPLGLISNKLEKLLKSAGPWKSYSDDWHTYSFILPFK